jgi:uncharacterized protein (TIGR00295 family)
MASIPSPKECLELLRETGCSDTVIKHCKAVRDVAVCIAQKAHGDVALVEAGALLHDIGRSKTHGIRHGVEGAKIARKLGLPMSIVCIIERHLGAGIPKEEAGALGLPVKSYMPQTLEEKIVAHADNLIDDSKRQPIEKQVERALHEGYPRYAERLIRLHKELSDLCGIDLNDI